MGSCKKTLILLLPLLLFAILFVPYSLVNQYMIVDWLGCSCPIVDGAGNIVENHFNANDFTAVFWSVIAILVVIVSAFLSKRILNENPRLRYLYIIVMLSISLVIAYQFCRSMAWG